MGALFDILKAIFEAIGNIGDFVSFVVNGAVELFELLGNIPGFMETFNGFLFSGVSAYLVALLLSITIVLRVLGRA